jgi:hypothetical protein
VTRALAKALVEGVAIYGLLGCLYVMAIAVGVPDRLDLRVSAFLPVRRDTFGVLCFLASLTAAIVWASLTSRPRP